MRAQVVTLLTTIMAMAGRSWKVSQKKAFLAFRDAGARPTALAPWHLTHHPHLPSPLVCASPMCAHTSPRVCSGLVDEQGNVAHRDTLLASLVGAACVASSDFLLSGLHERGADPNCLRDREGSTLLHFIACKMFRSCGCCSMPRHVLTCDGQLPTIPDTPPSMNS